MLRGALVCIEEALSTLNPKERKVADQILKDPKAIGDISVQRLAELSDVSVATIVRFSRSLNYKGFKELKYNIVADLVQNRETVTSYLEVPIGGSTASLIESISNNNIHSIQETLTLLSEESVDNAINQLRKARKITIFGVGASAVIAHDFQQKLSRINRWCESAFDFDSQATLAANSNESDVAFGISYSGETISIIDSLTIAKENGATIISLTKFGRNSVSEFADTKLFVSSLEKSIRSSAMASRIAQLNVIDILYLGIATYKYEESTKFLEKTRLAVQRGKQHKISR